MRVINTSIQVYRDTPTETESRALLQQLAGALQHNAKQNKTLNCSALMQRDLLRLVQLN